MAVMLSLAKLFKRNVYWSKDVILLTTDCGMAGAQAWVDAYHGLDQKGKSTDNGSPPPASPSVWNTLTRNRPVVSGDATVGRHSGRHQSRFPRHT